MKKYITIYLTLLLGFIVNAQVGVGTTNPVGTLHVDAGKNTSSAGTITDDVVVNTTGMSIGNTTPTTKLDITSTTLGAIKIVDGTQGTGKALTSDGNGVGTWQTHHSFKFMVPGTFGTTSVSSDATTTPVKYAEASIVLSKGKWMVNMGITIKLSGGTMNAQPYYLKSYLSSANDQISNTTFDFVGGSVRNFGGNVIKSQTPENPNFVVGSTIIDVAADNTPIFLLIENTQSTTRDWIFAPTNYENYLYATPVN